MLGLFLVPLFSQPADQLSAYSKYSKQGICDITGCHKNRVEIFLLPVEKKMYCMHYLREEKIASDRVIYHIERPACPKNFKQCLILSD